jgi:hypothetical protein
MCLAGFSCNDASSSGDSFSSICFCPPYAEGWSLILQSPSVSHRRLSFANELPQVSQVGSLTVFNVLALL